MTTPSGPTSTPIWGLEKPGGDEPVDILEAVHRNMDRLDKAGRRLCTSTTRPATGLFDGLCIYETDTRQQWTYVAGSPGGWANDSPAYAEFTFTASVANNSLQNIGPLTNVSSINRGKQFYSSPSNGRIVVSNTTPRSQYYSLVAEATADGPCGTRAFFEVTNAIINRQRILDPEQTSFLAVAIIIVDANSSRTFDFNLFHNIGVVRGFSGIIRLYKNTDV